MTLKKHLMMGEGRKSREGPLTLKASWGGHIKMYYSKSLIKYTNTWKKSKGKS